MLELLLCVMRYRLPNVVVWSLLGEVRWCVWSEGMGGKVCVKAWGVGVMHDC